jgi:ribosomal RNA-processing protein 36
MIRNSANFHTAEQKKLALVDKFQNMKGKQRERVIERRRKKVASREKKMMPADRRGV